MTKEEIINLIEERKCKLLVKFNDSGKEFKVNVGRRDEFTDISYKIFVNPFLDYSRELDSETSEFWTGEWYFDDLFSSMSNSRWTWEVVE